jgi:hypothetical protein
VGSTAIPAFVNDADFTVVGTIGDVVALGRDTFRRVFRQVDTAYLRALVRSEPEATFELLIGDDVVSLWFAGKRLAVVDTKGKKR